MPPARQGYARPYVDGQAPMAMPRDEPKTLSQKLFAPCATCATMCGLVCCCGMC